MNVAQPEGSKIGRAQDMFFFPSQAWLHVYNVYGFAQSAKFPDAKQRNHALLTHIVKHVQEAPEGPCLIVGDFNLKADEEIIFQQLQRSGWREVAAGHEFRTGHVVPFTCKHATRPDMIWMNPIALRFFVECEVLTDVGFADHSPLLAKFHWPTEVVQMLSWPSPKRIDMSSIDMEKVEALAKLLGNSSSHDCSWWLSGLSRLNGGEETFLLVTAALANLTFMSPLSTAAMKQYRTAQALVNVVRANFASTTLFSKDQVCSGSAFVV